MGRPERNFSAFLPARTKKQIFCPQAFFVFLSSGENEGRCLRHGAFCFFIFRDCSVGRRSAALLCIFSFDNGATGMLTWYGGPPRQAVRAWRTRRPWRQPRQHTLFASSDLLALDRYAVALPRFPVAPHPLPKTWKFLALERMGQPATDPRAAGQRACTTAPRCRTCRKAKLLTCNAPIRRPSGPISGLRPSALPPIRGMMFMSSTGQLPDSRRTSSPAARASRAGPGKARHGAGTEDHCREGAEDVGAGRAIFRRLACIDATPGGPSGSVADAGPRPRP